MNPSQKVFTMPEDAIQTQASIDIMATPQQVAAVYCDVARWDTTFPATIEHARIVDTGTNWQQILVVHKKEGRVPNTLFMLSDTAIGLKESKKRFDASFLNRFEPAGNNATHYVITSYVELRGIYRVLKPFLIPYVRQRSLKQMRSYVLEPLKAAVEETVG
jgi:hypothetical protein